MRKARLIYLLLLTIFVPILSVAADPATMSNIVGRWNDSETRSGEEFMFYSTGSFALTFPRTDVPVTKRLDGAYQLGSNTCNVGDANGNLWIVTGSIRCCYDAYFLADVLVLDIVGKTLGTGGMCKARTLKKQLSRKVGAS
ncbi:exported protein of unknown function [Denitratisoma oestradiolicum]|uniref:DUF2147 domain-containing protein n=1 Tax=Denitratisoma oestradiolicum TaxID=311182 RepID=A0A6S6XQE9_9PROT|nr:exported protein of unknown function [Denitratisoma oestradiolicum]